MAAKNTTKSTGRKGKGQGKHGIKNLAPAWKSGQSGNPRGRRKGQRDYATVVYEALKRIGQVKNMTPEEVEEAIQEAGVSKALKGSFFHFQEINNRLYGKPTDHIDLTSGGKTLADLIASSNGSSNRRKKDSSNAGAVQK